MIINTGSRTDTAGRVGKASSGPTLHSYPPRFTPRVFESKTDF